MWYPGSRKGRTDKTSPRGRLLRDLLLLLALTTGGLLAAVFYAGEMLRDDLALEQLQEAARKTAGDLSGFLLPMEKNLRMARGWGQAGDLDLNRPGQLVNRFIPMLENIKKASSLVLADSHGRSLFLTRDENGWLSRSVDGEDRAHWRHWAGPGRQTGERQGHLTFDPRIRPWYRGALEATDSEPVHWTRPYLFFTARTTGITGAIAYTTPTDPDTTYVIGLDVPLKKLLLALADLKLGERGVAFISEADGSVLVPPPDERGGLPVSLAPERFAAGPVFDAVAAWKTAERPAHTPLEFHRDGAWWTWMQPLSKRTDALWLGVTLPEVDFIGALQSGWHLILLVGGLVLAAGLILTLLLTRHYGRQLKTLPSFSDDPREFEDRILSLIRYGESPTLEFKSTMRTNLKTGKQGKEIELAWLKGVVGFLNTDGGVLLIGVNDEGEIVGTAADAFENGNFSLFTGSNKNKELNEYLFRIFLY